MSVVVVGSVNTDLVIHTPQIAAPGQTVVATGSATGHGGKGGNQAVAVARLGGACTLVARVGPGFDPASLPGVDASALIHDTAPTGLAVVQVDPSGENAITVVPGANANLSPADLPSFETQGVLLASLEVPLPAVIAAARAARAAGWTVVLNPAPAAELPAELLAAVDVLVPNQHELAVLGTPESLLAAGTGAVVVTLGGDGCRVYRNDHTEHIPTHPVDVVDTTGAGDAFCGALAWALDTGRDLPAAVRLATVAGALATRAVGARAALPTAAELDVTKGNR